MPPSRFALPMAAFAATAALANPIAPEAISHIGGHCTSTTFYTGNAPVPPATWQPTWTVTLHASTVTTSAAVDCGGCGHLATKELLLNYLYPSGPSPMVVETVMATEPTVTTIAHCSTPPPNQPAAPPMNRAFAMTPPPAPTPTATEQGRGESDGPTTSCVKHLLHAPHYTWGPTLTIWTSTTTVTEKINCEGCTSVQLDYLHFGPGPVISFNTTVTAATPSTLKVPACGGTDDKTAFGKRVAAVENTAATEPHYYEPPPMTTYSVTPEGVAKPTCTISKAVEPVIPNQTYTIYSSTTTATGVVDCSGCMMEWSTPVLYFFAPIMYTTSKVAESPSTSTVLACATPTA